MPTKQYPIETESSIWDLFSDTVPRTLTLNDQFQEWISQRVIQTYTAEQIERNPRYTDEHLEQFKRLVAEASDEK